MDNSQVRRSCSLIYSKELVRQLSLIPSIGPRQYYVHSLIHSYGLHSKLKIIRPVKASHEDLLAFHSRDYVDLLRDPHDSNPEAVNEAGLGYDCPVLENMLDWCCSIAGASLTAADHLLHHDDDEGAGVVINWDGGWHHAHRDSAAGFCYVNDIVLAIHRLQTRYKRVLYIDLDVHHGDGVEEAFSATDRVTTFSIHKFEAGYFPGTGSIRDIGTGRGRHHSINVPLEEGVTDGMYRNIFSTLFPDIMKQSDPDCVVLQCGADCLVGDALGGFNLTPEVVTDCVKDVLSYNVPLLILGGGGYHHQNTARCWTMITAAVLGETLDDDIPEDDAFFEKYGPDFQLPISQGCARNRNTQVDVDNMILAIRENIKQMKSTKQ